MEIEKLIKCKDLLNGIEKYKDLINYIDDCEYNKVDIEKYKNYYNFSILETLEVNSVIDTLLYKRNELQLIISNSCFVTENIEERINITNNCLKILDNIYLLDNLINSLGYVVSGEKNYVTKEQFIKIIDVYGKELVLSKLRFKLKQLENELTQI